MQGFAERSISYLVRLNHRSQTIGRSSVSTWQLSSECRSRYSRGYDCAARVEQQGARLILDVVNSPILL